VLRRGKAEFGENRRALAIVATGQQSFSELADDLRVDSGRGDQQRHRGRLARGDGAQARGDARLESSEKIMDVGIERADIDVAR
jgi:hypothetical protein